MDKSHFHRHDPSPFRCIAPTEERPKGCGDTAPFTTMPRYDQDYAMEAVIDATYAFTGVAYCEHHFNELVPEPFWNVA